MPPPPKLGNGAGAVGIAEILQEVEAEHPPQADGHIGIAGEIVINLHGVAQGAQPREGGGKASRLHSEGPVGHHGHLVGDEHLFPQSGEEAHTAGGNIGPALLAAVDLLGHRLIFDDGPGNELGEEGDVEAHLEGGALNLSPAPGHVQDVAQGLEGKEGDADGQADDGEGQTGPQAVENT